MSRFTSVLAASVFATFVSATALGQVTTIEQEPNSTKSEAKIVSGMVPGDCIVGGSTGPTTGVGNGAFNSADYWDLSTSAQSTPGWYRWTLTITPGNRLIVRGLTQTGVAGVGGTVDVGSDEFVMADSAGAVHWYSNDGPSRLYVSVTGDSSSSAFYSACLTCDPVASTPVAGSWTAGMLWVTTVGQTGNDTDISIADSTRTIIPGYLNDDNAGMSGLQSELLRPYTAGTYYVVICTFDQNNSEPAAADESFLGGEVMDYPNVFVCSSDFLLPDLTFLIDDSQGNGVVTVATTPLVHGIRFFEFTVDPGSPFSDTCNGDGGDQMGCTDCPCGNNAPAVMGGTIGGCENSAFSSSRLLPSGDPSVSLPPGDTSDLRFGVSGTPPNAFCILNSGDNVAPQGMANPCFGLDSGVQSATFDGLRCAVGNTLRHGGRSADVNGDVGVTNNPWGGEGGPPVGLAVAGGFAAGQTRVFQAIHREDPAAVCNTGLNTTQAVRLTFAP